MMANHTRLALLCTLAIGGCATSTYHAANHCGAPTTNVAVLRQPPADGTYVVCGSIHLEAGGAASDSTVIESLKEEAGKRGANAVVLIDDINAKLTLQYGYNRWGTVLAIRVKQPDGGLKR